MKQVKAPKLPKAPKAPKMPGTSRKKKKKNNHHKYFLFALAAFVLIGSVGMQFQADATPAPAEFKVTPVAAKKAARTNYVELKHR